MTGNARHAFFSNCQRSSIAFSRSPIVNHCVFCLSDFEHLGQELAIHYEQNIQAVCAECEVTPLVMLWHYSLIAKKKRNRRKIVFWAASIATKKVSLNGEHRTMIVIKIHTIRVPAFFRTQNNQSRDYDDLTATGTCTACSAATKPLYLQSLVLAESLPHMILIQVQY